MIRPLREPQMSNADDRVTAKQPAEPPQAVGSNGARTVAPLTGEDVHRLTVYKWRYALESSGFSTRQVGHLLFLKWLYAKHQIHG